MENLPEKPKIIKHDLTRLNSIREEYHQTVLYTTNLINDIENNGCLYSEDTLRSKKKQLHQLHSYFDHLDSLESQELKRIFNDVNYNFNNIVKYNQQKREYLKESDDVE